MLLLLYLISLRIPHAVEMQFHDTKIYKDNIRPVHADAVQQHQTGNVMPRTLSTVLECLCIRSQNLTFANS